jgi:hypothetical protein
MHMGVLCVHNILCVCVFRLRCTYLEGEVMASGIPEAPCLGAGVLAGRGKGSGSDARLTIFLC